MACMFIFMAAALGAFLFNLLMPQGIGFLPREMNNPLWRLATLAEAKELYDRSALFVDARDPGKYKLGHVRGAVNLPPEEYKFFYKLLSGQIKAAKQIVVYGRSLSRFPAADVAQRLRLAGMNQVWVMETGWSEWRMAGYPVREPRQRGRK